MVATRAGVRLPGWAMPYSSNSRANLSWYWSNVGFHLSRGSSSLSVRKMVPAYAAAVRKSSSVQTGGCCMSQSIRRRNGDALQLARLKFREAARIGAAGSNSNMPPKVLK
jgi:hypothetical protein